jgi:hypothetical protein
MGAGLIIIRSLSGADYYDAVSDGGCDNTGESDCVSDILAAVTAYKAAGKDGLYFPAGEYLLSSALTVPDGTTLVGAGMATAHLKGGVRFGSTSSFTDLKIGTSEVYTGPTLGATATDFTRCTFEGGTTQAPIWGALIINRTSNNLTFTDCTIAESPWNGISINAIDDSIHDITFDSCHILEQACMGFECTNRGTGTVGYSNINLIDCVFEVQGAEAVSYDGNRYSGNCLVDGCLLKGSGNNPDYPWGQGFEINGPTNMTVTGTTIYRTYSTTLNLGSSGGYLGVTNNTFTDCTFDQSVNYLTRNPSFNTDVNGPSAPMLLSADMVGWTFDNCIFNAGDKVRRRIIGLQDASTGNDFSTCTFTGGEWVTGTSAVTVYDPDYPEDGNIYPSGTVVEGWGVVP